MNKSWVLVANKSTARVFERTNRKTLKLIEVLVNPSAKMSEATQVSDRQGSMAQSNGHGHQSFSPQTSAKRHSEESFAKEINQFLESCRTKHKFDSLTIAAPPAFLGMLKNNLDKELNKEVVNYLNKDLSQKSDKELIKLMAA